MAETYTFQAEIRQLLYTLIHSLYSEREIFLRELLSNSSDALNRIQFEMLTNREVREPDAPLAIRITANEEAGTLIVSDNGIGMTQEEVVENLGTISKSGVKAFLEQAKGNGQISNDLIGQFGVGFYSIFMVADKVEVNTLSYRLDSKPIKWVSSGEATFEVEIGDKTTRGTEIVLYLKEDAQEFLQTYRLKNVIKTHSNYLAFPIYLGDEAEPVNEQKAIWRRPANEISEDDYQSFYKSLTLDFKDPLLHIHTSADAPVQYYMLLYLPANREPSIFSPRKEPGLQLYSRKILIQNYCTDLLPDYLSFVQGVVDTEDLPLNVSRETVQANRVMATLKKAVTGRVLRDLNQTAKNNQQLYDEFWGEFGPFLKQGMITDAENQDRLTPLLRFYSANSEDKLISLEEYVEKMQEVKGQELIYYILGDNKSTVSRSPHLEPFRGRGIDVLYFTETVDSFLINSLFEYNGHKLQNVDDENLDLSEIGELQENVPESEKIAESALEGLLERFTNVLEGRVQAVRVSKVLTSQNNPARLVSPEGTLDRHTQRVYQMLDKKYEIPRKILEVNPHHGLIRNLAYDLTHPLTEAAIEQIYENALLLDGLHPNPSEMVERIQRFMEAATSSGT